MAQVSEPPVCACGLLAIGRCTGCSRWLCDFHGERYVDRFVCVDDREALAAADLRAKQLNALRRRRWTKDHLLAWQAEGHSLEAALTWAKTGATADQAQALVSAGCTVDDVTAWAKTGWPVAAVVRWCSAGQSVTEGHRWATTGANFNAALNWAKAGATADQAQSLISAGCSVDDATAWAKTGWPVAAIERWCSAGRTITEGHRWATIGASFDAATCLSDAGVEPNDGAPVLAIWSANDLAAWLSDGRSFTEAERWVDLAVPWEVARHWGPETNAEDVAWAQAGCTPATARQWQRHDFGLVATGRWIRAGYSAAEASAWCDAGVRLSAVKRWVALGVGPATASRWTSLGFTQRRVASWANATATWIDPTDGLPGLWIEQQWAPLQAERAAKVRLSPAKAKEWVTAGFAVTDAAEWTRLGVSVAEAGRAEKRCARCNHEKSFAGLLRLHDTIVCIDCHTPCSVCGGDFKRNELSQRIVESGEMALTCDSCATQPATG